MMQQPRQVCISSERIDRLDGKIRVVRDMPRKIIRRELVLRIQPFLLQILRPLRKLGPVPFRQLRTMFRLRQRIDQDEHVPALLNRHLILFRLLSAPVHLPIRQGILP